MSFSVNVLLVFIMFSGCAAAIPVTSGARNQHALAPCPSSPNCVSSLSQDEAHFIKPFACSLPPAAAREALARVVAMLKGGRVVVSEGNYLRAEFVSSWFKFVDDVEFIIDQKSGVINLRSASRVGYSDFGVNRRRLESLREHFMKILSEP